MNILRDRVSYNRSIRTNKRTLPILLCALALGTALVPAAPAQVVEGYIQLPDSLGPILPPYDVAVDYSPGAERLFIGSDSGVLDAGIQQPGSHRLSWTHTQEGRRLGAGAYFVLLDMGSGQVHLKSIVR